ncbi:MAG: ABC transporter substrate-binding protein [Bdellovibrio sp.]|nr:ABC transporter substrate-binding protein [Bdellovibrio sp.]
MRLLIYTTILILAPTLVKAKELILDMLEFAPVVVPDHPSKGLVGEIVQEAINKSGYKAKIYFMPARRAIATAPLEKNTLIVPLARLKEREADFTWIAPLIAVDRVFFTTGKTVDSYKKAKSTYKAIAVSRGTAGTSILRAQGFTEKQIIEVNKGESAPSMLLANHADAWFNSVSEGLIVLKSIDTEKRVIKGGVVGVSTHYLACSKECDAVMVQKLRQTLKAMATDGTLKKIISKHEKFEGIELVPNFED